jgi:hypothetical protein
LDNIESKSRFETRAIIYSVIPEPSKYILNSSVVISILDSIEEYKEKIEPLALGRNPLGIDLPIEYMYKIRITEIK